MLFLCSDRRVLYVAWLQDKLLRCKTPGEVSNAFAGRIEKNQKERTGLLPYGSAQTDTCDSGSGALIGMPA